MGLNILILGSGGREHALAWALARSPQVAQIFVAPGNAGTAADGASQGAASAQVSNWPLAADDLPGLLAFAREQRIDLTVVGPEGPLAAGIVDRFEAAGLRIFGPTQAAARLEVSKAFAKSFMQAHHIPTAPFGIFDVYEEAVHYVRATDHPLVIKADGLAAGKGVIVCDTQAEALEALRRVMVAREFGPAGETVVIEERLTGRELSLLAFTDGHTVVPMPPTRDHKRLLDGDQGPNTGGMGAYSPMPDVDMALVDVICDTMLAPAVRGMAAQGSPYRGVLYAGVMLTPLGPQLLEFNCRFGDPETQVILPRLASDLLDIMLACVEGRLTPAAVQWHPHACATVVLAAPGYPASYPKGLPIEGLTAASDDGQCLVFHAGTALQDGGVVTAGGRVLAVTALGDDLPTALAHAYAGVAHLHFPGMHYRHDIGSPAHL